MTNSILKVVTGFIVLAGLSAHADFIAGKDQPIKKANMTVQSADGVFASFDNKKVLVLETKSDLSNQIKLVVDLNSVGMGIVSSNTLRLMKQFTFNVVINKSEECGRLMTAQLASTATAAFVDDMSMTLTESTSAACNLNHDWTADIVYSSDGIVLGKMQLVGSSVAVYHTL